MAASSASFSMNILILLSPIFMQSTLFFLPSMITVSISPLSNMSEITWLESNTWDEKIAYSIIFSGSLRSIMAEVVFRSM